MSTGFIAIRIGLARPAHPGIHREHTDLTEAFCAGTMKNPRQTFRPTGGSLNLETLFTCDSAGRLATYHPQVFSRV